MPSIVVFHRASDYDGGDCCECTCVSTVDYTCGTHHHGGYACLDPSAPCVDDDDITTLPDYEYTSASQSTSTCFEAVLGDGDCDPINNNEDCGTSHSLVICWSPFLASR